FSVDMIEKILARNTEAQTLHISGKRFGVVRNRFAGSAAVLRVRTGDDLQETRGVGDGSGHWPYVIESPTEGGHAEAADSPVGRLQTHDAATFGGIADGAAGIAS